MSELSEILRDLRREIEAGLTSGLPQPASGYRAFMGEVTLTNSFGHEYRLSTQVQVVPDEVK